MLSCRRPFCSAMMAAMIQPLAQISAPMKALSAYIAEAAVRPLPPEVAERAGHHALDTLAAMISGSRLVPGRSALAFIAAQGGAREASVPGSRIVTSAINAAARHRRLACAALRRDRKST